MFHLFPPGTSELDTITDFNSFVGVAKIDGTGAGDNAGLSFEVDNRFITRGVHRTGQAALQRTFGFLWLDSSQGPVGSNQIHDFTPGIAASGLFCTTRVPDSLAPVSPGSGRATWILENFEIGHFHDPLNSLHHGKPV